MTPKPDGANIPDSAAGGLEEEMLENTRLEKTQGARFGSCFVESQNFTLITEVQKKKNPQGIMQEEKHDGDTVERLLRGHPLHEKPPQS